MAKQKGNPFFFRIDDASFKKFNAILDAQNDLCKKMGVGQMTRTQVLRNIINDQYLAYLNNTKDPDKRYFDRYSFEKEVFKASDRRNQWSSYLRP